MRSLIILVSLLFMGCATVAPVTNDSGVVSEQPVVAGRTVLSWEKTTEPHPERAPWSDALIAAVTSKLDVYEGASDVTKFCPKFKSLPKELKIKALSELMIGMSYYESGYKPEVIYRECSSTCKYSSGCQYSAQYGYCMKGGHALDGGIVISRGLFQLSLESSQSYGCPLKKPEDLHDPIKNIECANRILARQVERRGSFTTASNYWAVLKSSYAKNKISEISGRVQKYALYCK